MIIRRFWDKNQAKTDRKIRKTKCATKVDENMVPGITFGPRVDFWWILGLRRGPKNDPKSDPEMENQDLIGPGSPQGAPRANFGIIFWTFFEKKMQKLEK